MQGLAEADVGLFVVDARAGVTAADQELADELRRQQKPVLLVANKCEGRLAEAQLAEAWSLGLGEPLPVSAEHGDGIPDLLLALAPYLNGGPAPTTPRRIRARQNRRAEPGAPAAAGGGRAPQRRQVVADQPADRRRTGC